MNFSIQPELENELVILSPLMEQDFDDLFAAAADPKIWEQHPNKDRYKKEIFRIFFDKAIQSEGAFKILDKTKGKIIGSTRYYTYNEKENSILIGYTFFATDCWGKGINRSVKILMLNYIFQFVSIVYFHIGSFNIRSQLAISQLGVTKIGEIEVVIPDEELKVNCVYMLTKEKWFFSSSP